MKLKEISRTVKFNTPTKKQEPDWLAYRMELAKELAVASVRSKGAFDSDQIMLAVDNIVKKLQENNPNRVGPTD